MAMHRIEEIHIDKSDLSNLRVSEHTVDSDHLNDGQVLLKNDSFGFSANNITYALLGDRMGYWGFFPAEEGWGVVPVWGFASVVESRHPDIAVGEKVFGYLPLATHLLIDAGKVTSKGFFDVAAQRKSISPVYDNYLRCGADPGYNPDAEAWQLNFRPLFTTSFVLDDFVGEHLVDGINTIVLTSASSKTAYGTAFLLSQNRAERGRDYRVVGVTSATNLEFVRQTGCYDEVLTYDAVDKLRFEQGAWVLDFAGNKALLLALQEKLAGSDSRLTFIGVTDVQSQADGTEGALDGEVFFAPAQVKKRHADWGQDGFLLRYAQAWQGFSQQFGTMLHEQPVTGIEEIKQLYGKGLSGNLDTQAMYVAKF